MVLMIPLNAFIARRTRAQQVLQMKQKDQRIKLMNEVSCHIVHVCRFGLKESPPFTHFFKVNRSRVQCSCHAPYESRFSTESK